MTVPPVEVVAGALVRLTQQDYACDHGSETRLVSYQIALSIQ